MIAYRHMMVYCPPHFLPVEDGLLYPHTADGGGSGGSRRYLTITPPNVSIQGVNPTKAPDGTRYERRLAAKRHAQLPKRQWLYGAISGSSQHVQWELCLLEYALHPWDA
jgi:hypothetical protein